MMMLSVTSCATVWNTIWGTAFLSWSIVVFDVSPGQAVSSCPAWSAAVRVPRSTITTYLSPSRYGRPLTK
jgi:hypothetical protein